MSDSCSDVVFFVVHAGLELTRLSDEIRIGEDVFDVVGRCISPRPNADRLVRFIRYDPGILERRPSEF